MNNKPQEQSDELLARATAALRGAQPSDSPPAELVTKTVERMRGLDLQPAPTTLGPDLARPTARRKLMLRIARYGAATSAVLLAAVLMGWLPFLDKTARPAFAQVIDTVAKAESVALVSKSARRHDATGEVLESEHVKWYIQGQKIRMEEVGGATAVIVDAEQNRFVAIDLKRKTASPEALVDEVKEMVIDPVSQIRSVKPDEARLVGHEKLNGRAMHVYRLDKLEFLMIRGRGRMTVWVDSQTLLPAKMVLEQTQRGQVTAHIDLIDFVWNQGIDDKLFQIPTDYTIEEIKVRKSKKRQ